MATGSQNSTSNVSNQKNAFITDVDVPNKIKFTLPPEAIMMRLDKLALKRIY
jgi:hypothetical protein